jgi:hypothetical protein
VNIARLPGGILTVWMKVQKELPYKKEALDKKLS